MEKIKEEEIQTEKNFYTFCRIIILDDSYKLK